MNKLILEVDKRLDKRFTVLLALIALEGFAALAGQSVVVRELLTTFGGNELVIGLAFGFWLLWVAAGAAVTSRLIGRRGHEAKDEDRGKERSDRATLLVAASLGPALVVEFLLVRVVAGGVFTRPGELPGLFWTAAAACLLLAPFSVLIGAFFPLAARSVARDLASRSSGETKNVVALVYAAEAAGGLAGGLAFTFVFAGNVSHTALALAIGAALLALAGLGAWKLADSFRKRARIAFSASAAGAALAMFLSAIFASGPLERATARRGGRIDASYNVIASRDTPHQHLLLVEREGQHVLFAGGEPALTYEPADPGPWLAAHRALAWADRVERCLIIGFDPAAVRASLEQGAGRVDVVEQDAGVVELIEPLLRKRDRAALEDARVHIHTEDARRFLSRRRTSDVFTRDEGYDFVMLTCRDPTSALVNRFFTREFFTDVRDSMSAGGIFTFAASSQANTLDEDALSYLRGLRATLRSVFGHVTVADDEGSARFFSARVFALRGLRPPPRLFRERMEGRYPALAAYFTDANLAPERGRKLDELTRVPEGVPVDTDLRPRAYLNFLRIWDRLSGSNVRAWLDLAGALRLWHVIALAVVMTMVCVPLARKAQSVGRPAIFIGGAAGFAAMVLTVALLLAYQCLHGKVYQAVGALSAAFMAGFAGGSFAAERLARRGAVPGKWALAADAAGVIVILLSLGLLRTNAMGMPLVGSALFALLLALAGAAVGLELPLLARWIAPGADPATSPEATARAAGAIDAADHAGAFAGALLAGTLLVPALGIPGALVALACLRLASLAALGVRALRRS